MKKGDPKLPLGGLHKHRRAKKTPQKEGGEGQTKQTGNPQRLSRCDKGAWKIGHSAQRPEPEVGWPSITIQHVVPTLSK